MLYISFIFQKETTLLKRTEIFFTYMRLHMVPFRHNQLVGYFIVTMFLLAS